MSGPRSFALNWVREPGAEACISSQVLARSIEQWLGPVFDRPSEAELAIEGRVAHDASSASWRAYVRVADARGSVLGARELSSTAPNCHALDAQVALVIVMAIDPEVALRGLPDELLEEFSVQNDAAAQLLEELRAQHDTATARVGGAPAVATARASAAPKSAPSAQPSTDKARDQDSEGSGNASTATEHDWHFEPFAGAALSVGIQPAPAAGIGLGMRAQSPSWWALVLNGTLWLPTDTRVTVQSHALQFHALQASLGFCPRLWQGATWLWTSCAGATIGDRWPDPGPLHARPGSSRAYWAPTMGSELQFRPARHWFVQLAVATGLVSPRDRFKYANVSGRTLDLFVPPAVAGWGFLAIGASF